MMELEIDYIYPLQLKLKLSHCTNFLLEMWETVGKITSVGLEVCYEKKIKC